MLCRPFRPQRESSLRDAKESTEFGMLSLRETWNKNHRGMGCKCGYNRTQQHAFPLAVPTP